MSDRLIQSHKRLHDSLFELYIDGGLELYLAGTRGLKRDLIMRLVTSALTPEKGEIIRYYAVNRWDDEDEFDEWARASGTLSPEAERVLGLKNEQLVNCRSTDVVLEDFLTFVAA